VCGEGTKVIARVQGQAVSTYSGRHRWLNIEIEEGNAGPSARRLNSIAAQPRRGEFGWLAQDDNLLYFSKLSEFPFFPFVDTV
jgi:hypothetical protein